ncbi:tyrosine-type recombinase/integrase [Candidatus Viadribacter manganicus]|uniref:Integrase n=1 Tax=Candidatus Viadribacter manganicus TaxID=1759059 RepID=A0A1B1AHA9_9PROT|nr:integrase arm-type DNA-binding domain-containing protein [Candidatus Viadribacter manganicus]ANP45920.1 hypothetical protein ATE48_08290 [Candidatus Viadribacter manganicus]
MPLTEPQVRTAKPDERAYKLYDSGGLFLLVTPSGGKIWRFRFKRDGKEKLLSLGTYPIVGLSAARKKRNAAIEKLQDGVDPAEERRQLKLARMQARKHTFKSVALEWHAMREDEWTPDYARQVLSRLEADVFPALGDKAVAEIKPAQMLEVLKAVEARGVLETNRRLKQYCSAIFRYGIASQYCEHDPAAPLKGALKSPGRPKHHSTIPRSEVGAFLLKLDAYDGDIETRIAINLALLMAPRTTELRAAQWTEFEQFHDAERALWRIPEARMKMGEQHLVPLSRQARTLLSVLRERTGRSKFLFPSGTREGVMSNNTMLFGLYRMGYHGRLTTHGFRRLFSTEANEQGWNEDWVERQLAHDERDRVRAAYNAAQYLPQRRELMQWWADRLDAWKAEEIAKRGLTSDGDDGSQRR